MVSRGPWEWGGAVHVPHSATALCFLLCCTLLLSPGLRSPSDRGKCLLGAFLHHCCWQHFFLLTSLWERVWLLLLWSPICWCEQGCGHPAVLEWELWVWGFWCCCNSPTSSPHHPTHRMGCVKSKEDSIQEKMQLGRGKKDPTSGSKQVSGSCSVLGGHREHGATWVAVGTGLGWALR